MVGWHGFTWVYHIGLFIMAIEMVPMSSVASLEEQAQLEAQVPCQAELFTNTKSVRI
jgi:hypothetical protein